MGATKEGLKNDGADLVAGVGSKHLTLAEDSLDGQRR